MWSTLCFRHRNFLTISKTFQHDATDCRHTKPQLSFKKERQEPMGIDTIQFMPTHLKLKLPREDSFILEGTDEHCYSSSSLASEFFPNSFSGFQLSCWDQDKQQRHSKNHPQHPALTMPIDPRSSQKISFQHSTNMDDDGINNDDLYNSDNNLVLDDQDESIDNRNNYKKDTSRKECSDRCKDFLSKHHHVHFGMNDVIYEYERPSTEDYYSLYYSGHELQRLQDQARLDGYDDVLLAKTSC